MRIVPTVETKWEGLVPDYGDDYLYAIFVKLEREEDFKILSVDPVPIAARQVSGVWEKVPDQSSVLIDYKVWLDAADGGGRVYFEFTYQYPGWPVRTYSGSFSYL